jgi:hypothetical protein
MHVCKSRGGTDQVMVATEEHTIGFAVLDKEQEGMVGTKPGSD